MKLHFSIVVPVYNRPEELRELLESLVGQRYDHPFEMVVVEDGSNRDAASVIGEYRDRLDLSYWQKPNTGPGDSRNFGMRKALGNYIILVDSDCILPPDYLHTVHEQLDAAYADCFGGRDAAHPSFNALQKAISFSMTSPLTTGGLRGSAGEQKNFQPRSFNMGLSKEAYQASGGFGRIHPGEDPDLSLRLLKMGYTIRYIPQAVVYHKRRIDFRSFYRQVHKFGLTRPILNRWHPGTGRITYWFPTLFCLGLVASMLLPVFWREPLAWTPLVLYAAYLLLLGLLAGVQTRSLRVALLVLAAVPVQFCGYGLGFLKSSGLLTFSKKKPEDLFPGLFFKS